MVVTKKTQIMAEASEYAYCNGDRYEGSDDKDSKVYSVKSKGAEHHKKVRSKIKDIEHIPIDPEWIDYI